MGGACVRIMPGCGGGTTDVHRRRRMNPPPPDRAEQLGQWLEAARAGSPEALGRALEACRAYLLHVANAELDPGLRAKAGASDLVQETVLEAQRIFERFHGSDAGELHAWLRAILSNKLATFTRQYRSTDKRQVAREQSLSPAAPLGPAPVSTPSAAAVRLEVAGAVERALEKLPEHYRQVIRWRQWEGLSFEEIARRLDRTPDAARMLWWRAVERLEQELGPQQ